VGPLSLSHPCVSEDLRLGLMIDPRCHESDREKDRGDGERSEIAKVKICVILIKLTFRERR